MKQECIKMDLATAKKVYKTSPPELKTELEQKFGKAKLSDDICDLIQTLDDVYALNKTTAAAVLPFPKPKNKDERSTNATCIIRQLTRAYNQGKVLDWLDTNQSKYFLYFERTKKGWVLDVVVGCLYVACLGFGCYFAVEKHARDAYAKFPKVWEDYLPE